MNLLEIPMTNNICTHCGGVMKGQEGSRTCLNFSCGAYEVDDDNYDLPRSKRHDLPKYKRVKK